jgi:hypothetical protein
MERDSANWRTSSFSTANGGQCVEVGDLASGVAVRDTADHPGPVLAFSDGAWRTLLAEVRAA